MVKKMFVASLFMIGAVITQAQQNALDFDGIDDYVNLNSLGASMGTTSNFMVQMWIKADKNEQGNIRTTFFSVHDQFGNNKLILNVGGPYSQLGKLMIYTPSGLAYTSSTIIGDNQCHHIFLIKSGSMCRVFIDGIYSGVFSTSLTLLPTDRYSLGQEWDLNAPSDFYNGQIDEFSIWNQALFPSNFPASIHLPLTGTETGLVGYYTFDQGVAYGNNTAINYLSDFNSPTNDGTLLNFALDPSGATPTAYSNWVPGECFADSSLCANANQISLDGTNDYVNLDAVNSTVTSSTDFTVEFWMKANLASQGPDARVAMFAINSSNGSVNRFCIWLGGFNSQTGNLVITDEGAWGTQNDFISTQVIADDECHHIAYTRSGNVGTIYLDGTQIGTHQADFNWAANDHFSLGQEYDAGFPIVPSQFYEGSFDDFRIWSVARTQAEIASTMSAPLTGSEPNLLLYYNFNQGVSGGSNPGLTTVIDQAGSFNGTLVNFALNGASSNWILEECIDCNDDTVKALGIADNQNENSFSIYPNPATNTTTIQIFGSNQLSTVTIYDMTGKIIYSNQFNSTVEVETSSFNRGIYVVVVSNSNQKFVEKLIVQ